MAVGARVSDTIRTKIVDVDLFTDNPALLMLGMVCAVTASSLYLTFATRFGMSVSTTHSILGGVLGMGIAAVGSDGIHWWGGNVNSGVTQVFLAWIIAPVLSGCFGAIIFLITKYGVMLRRNPVMKAFISIPIYFGVTSALLTSKCGYVQAICVEFILTHTAVLIVWKGGSAKIKLNNSETIGIIFGVGIGVALVVATFFLPWLYRVLIKDDWKLRWWHVFLGPLVLRRGEIPPPPEGQSTVQDYYRGHLTMEQLKAQRAAAQAKLKDIEHGGAASREKEAEASDDAIHSDSDGTAPASIAEPQKSSIIGPRPEGSNFSLPVLFWQFKRVFFHGVDQDIISMQKKRDLLSGDIEAIHARVTHYDNKAEYMYSFLQIMTAATASFSHGANDVAK